MERERVKALIELSETFEEADAIIQRYLSSDESRIKIAFLKGMFDCQVLNTERKNVQYDYVALLTSIVERRREV